ncbi:MAG TPA: biopolymer transporter ExbD [Azospira sp.]|nr:biopolymer transporter ExbD [Azospira sp.]
MAFASLDTGGDDAPLAEINMVPLIDVMLVLLIIFMVTAPLLTHTVKVDLPKAASVADTGRGDAIQLAIDAAGRLHWNGEALDADAFAARLAAAGAQQPPPELHLRAERTTPYERVAQVMSEAARHRLTRIGFVTDPSTVAH